MSPIFLHDELDCKTNIEWYRYPPSSVYQVGDLVYIKSKSSHPGVHATVQANSNNDLEKIQVACSDNHIKYVRPCQLLHRLDIDGQHSQQQQQQQQQQNLLVLLTRSTTEYRQAITAHSTSTHVALELGCSYGEATILLARRASRVLAVDTSSIAIEAAQLKCQAFLSTVSFENLNVITEPQRLLQWIQSLLLNQITTTNTINMICLDIGGNRDLDSVVHVLHWLFEQIINNDNSEALLFSKTRILIIVKSEELIDTFQKYQPQTPLIGKIHQSHEWWTRVLKLQSSKNTLAPTYYKHPLQAPQVVDTHGTIICRYHNFHPDGCARFRDDSCPFNHYTCHTCRKTGHTAKQCVTTTC